MTGAARVVGVLLLAMSLSVASSALTPAQAQFPYQAFEALPKTDLDVTGGVIHVAFAPGEFALPQSRILDWVRGSADAVSTYYGRFPVKATRLLIVPVAGRGIRRGQAWGYRGAAIRIALGTDTSEDDLARDWVMVHEMVHLALPDMDAQHNWLSEGLAVYVESIARAQAGHIPVRSVWLSFVSDMPKGLPQEGDQGFDNTPTWGRTYWGGAMFCLLAEIEIRKRTGNRLGLQDAMRGVLLAGGNHEQFWPIRRILAAADEATGLSVLTDLYEEMRGRPVDPNLDRLWRDLGLGISGDGVVFNDNAPLAATRTAITARPPR